MGTFNGKEIRKSDQELDCDKKYYSMYDFINNKIN